MNYTQELEKFINTEHDLVSLLEDLNKKYQDPDVLTEYKSILEGKSIGFSILPNEDNGHGSATYVSIKFDIVKDCGMYADGRPNVDIKVIAVKTYEE